MTKVHWRNRKALIYRQSRRRVFRVVPRLVLGQNVFCFCLVATDVTVPLEVSGEVDALHMVLHVHLPLVAEGATAADIAALHLHHILHQVVIAAHQGGVEP